MYTLKTLPKKIRLSILLLLVLAAAGFQFTDAVPDFFSGLVFGLIIGLLLGELIFYFNDRKAG